MKRRMRSKESISKNMKAVRSKDTTIEISLRKELWHFGFRYRKNVRGIFGCPDIVSVGARCVIFIDSEFWHGYKWSETKQNLKVNREFWFKKIEYNIRRDIKVNTTLVESGWLVIRVWGNAIRKNSRDCAKWIISIIETRRACSSKKGEIITYEPASLE